MNNKNVAMTLGLAVLVSLGAGCDRERGDKVADADTLPATPAVTPPPAAAMDAAATPADDPLAFDRWDSSRDTHIDANEFNAGFAQGTWFHDWDTDNNGELSRDEFKAANARWTNAPTDVDRDGLFDTWDSDHDGTVDTVEVNTGVFSTWDRDSNGMLDNDEYDAGVNWFGWR